MYHHLPKIEPACKTKFHRPVNQLFARFIRSRGLDVVETLWLGQVHRVGEGKVAAAIKQIREHRRPARLRNRNIGRGDDDVVNGKQLLR